MLEASDNTSGAGVEFSVINAIADTHGHSYPNPCRLATDPTIYVYVMKHQDLRKLFLTRGWWPWPSLVCCQVASNHSIGSLLCSGYVVSDAERLRGPM